MNKDTLLPQGEGIRNAVRWFSEQGDYSAATIEEAARRFDLSPVEEDFLLRHFQTSVDDEKNKSP